MTRVRRVFPLLLPLLFVHACTDQHPTSVDAVGDPSSVVANYYVPGFYFLPPVGEGVSSDDFVGTLSPTVLVCPASSQPCVDNTTALAEFTKTSGTGGAVVTVASDNSYQVNWKVDDTLVPIDPNVMYQIVVRLGGHLLGTVDIMIFDNMGQARKKTGEYFALVDGRTLPIKFGITDQAVFSLVDVDPADLPSDDFVITTFSTEGGIQTAAVPSGNAAFRVNGDSVQGLAAGTDFTLVIYEKALSAEGICETTYNGPNSGGCFVYETIPSNLTFENGEGGPAGIVGVCPDENAGEEFLLAQTSDGVTTFPDLAPVNVVDCTGLAANRLPAPLRFLARMLLPQPLHAKDEGESGMVRAFSTFFWAMPLAVEENPDAPWPTTVLPAGQAVPISFRVVNTHTHIDAPHPHPVSGVLVDFEIAQGGGTLSAPSAISDASGVATVLWTPAVAGPASLAAKISNAGDPVPTDTFFTTVQSALTGLLLHYTFDGNANNSGLLSGYDGVAGSVTYPGGVSGQAIRFDGTSGTGVTFPNTADVFASGGSKWTISMWFREDVKQPETGLFHFRAPQRGWETYHGVPEPPDQRMITCSDGGCLSFVSTAAEWHSLVYRYDGQSSTVGAPVEIYVDGVLTGTLDNAGLLPLVSSGVADVTMGRAPFGPSVFYVDDFKVYNQVFSEADQCNIVIGGLWDASEQTCATSLVGQLTDAAGDAGTGPDLTASWIAIDGSNLRLRVDFAPGTMVPGTRVDLHLDTDENTETGHPGTTAGGTDSDLLGVDRLIRIGSNQFSGGQAVVFQGNPNSTITTIEVLPSAVTYHANHLEVIIPMALISDDGLLRYKLNVSTQLTATTSTGVTDFMTNVGVAPGTTY